MTTHRPGWEHPLSPQIWGPPSAPGISVVAARLFVRLSHVLMYPVDVPASVRGRHPNLESTGCPGYLLEDIYLKCCRMLFLFLLSLPHSLLP